MLLEVEGISKSFDGFAAVSGANLAVEKGHIVAVIGPNGAGKTTLFNLITGQLKPNAGRILFNGEDIAALPPYRVCKKGISRSFQVVNVFPLLTVFENVQVAVLSHQGKSNRLLSPIRKQGREETINILESLGLLDKAEDSSSALSHGDQKVLEMAIALGNDPELLILDEPTAGMSPEETRHTTDLIKSLPNERGLTVLFCEHDLGLVFDIAQELMVMHQGRSLTQDEPEQVRKNREVQDAYLGGEQ